MPANLPPQYLKAEDAYRQAASAENQIVCLERMLQLIPKHKGTEKLQADIKSRLKAARQFASADQGGNRAPAAERFPRQGAGRIVILGGPNSGKSRLLGELTSAQPQIAEFPFSTTTFLPAMMPFEDTNVQLIDTAPVTPGHCQTGLVNLLRASDAAVLCFDGSCDDAPEATAHVVNELARRRTVLSEKTGFAAGDYTTVELRTLLVITRGDDPDASLRLELLQESLSMLPEAFFAQLDIQSDCDVLRKRIYRLLDVIRVYTKRPGTPPQYTEPYTLRRPATVTDLAEKVHDDLAGRLRFANIWTRADGTLRTAGKDGELEEGDMVELHC